METSKQVTEAEKAVEEDLERMTRRIQWKWAEASIWADAMLKALDNEVKGNKWFSLIDKVYRRATLEEAWNMVKANKGAAGVDKITVPLWEVVHYAK